MAATSRHELYAARYNTTIIPGITRMGIPTGIETRGERTSGEFRSHTQTIIEQAPRIPMSTINPKGLLDILGSSGIAAGGVAIGSSAIFSAWAYKHAEGGTRAGTLSHRLYQFNEGILVPRRLVAEQRGDVSLDFEAIGTYDGTNAILTTTDSITVPAAGQDEARWTIGPVTLESIALTHIRRIEIDFGVQTEEIATDGDIAPTFTSIIAYEPMVRITAINPLQLGGSAIPLDGKFATHANTTLYLRKRAHGGTIVANGTAEHISFTFEGMATVQDAFSGGVGDAGEIVIECKLNYDGTNAMFVMDTASAIS